MVFSIRELIDIIIMTGAVGYIFMNLFRRNKGFDKETFILACWVTGPALIAHELAHKFLAMGLGYEATFHAAYGWLVIGLVLSMVGFVLFVPGYVSIAGANLTTEASAAIAFAGPFLNLVLCVGAWIWLKQPKLSKRKFIILELTKKINFFLFVFNMLPIPFFDGAKVWRGVAQIFLG